MTSFISEQSTELNQVTQLTESIKSVHLAESIPSSEDRYSRQTYTVGKDMMKKLSDARVLIIGYNMTSQEIIKNLVLLGIGIVDIYSNQKLESWEKTGLYYPTDGDQVPLEQIQKLNPTIRVSQVTDIFDENQEYNSEAIKRYSVVIISNSTMDDAQNLNRICRKFDTKFIFTGTFGLMGYIFNDFGENFVVTDTDGESYKNLMIKSIDPSDKKIIEFKDGHGLGDGDYLEVTLISGEKYDVRNKQIVNPNKIELTAELEHDKLEIKSMIKKKVPQEFNFNLLKDQMNVSDNISFTYTDFSIDFERPRELHELVLTYNKFYQTYGFTPKAWSISDFEAFVSLIPDFASRPEKFKILSKKFCYTLRGNILPFGSIIGGIVSQEVLKALGHKYIPISQWCYIDYYDLITDSEVETFDDYSAFNYNTITNKKYEGIINVFGKKLFEKIMNSSPFVVGSGAIGCEILKNLGMLGLLTIFVTDPDHIEISNLSRQFLFNNSNIRHSKSETAAAKIKEFNPDTNVLPFKNKVCPDTEFIFDNEFYSQIDILLNALDNVDARVYMDSRAIKYSLPLIDSGTLGTKGNVQVVVPYLTESYGSSKDPEDKAGIPICTIKTFPYRPEHTIQWARELFEEQFYTNMILIDKYRDPSNLMSTPEGEVKLFYRQFFKFKNFAKTPEGYFKLLSTIFYENFYENIEEIIKKYTGEEKEKLEDNKLPTHIEINMETIRYFMTWGFKILNQVFDTNYVYLPTNSITPIIFKDNIETIRSEEVLEFIISNLTDFPQVNKIEFEKDEDELGHVQFVTECANIRNTQYSIPLQDIYETRKIAGNIIPAMITTTALVSGFQIMEYLKIIKFYEPKKHITNQYDSDIDIYKNRFVNLNINYIDGINPGKVESQIVNGNKISIWTSIKVSSNITSQIISEIEAFAGTKLEYLAEGVKEIYDGTTIFEECVDPNERIQALIFIEGNGVELRICF